MMPLPRLLLPLLLTLSLSACGLFSGSKDEAPPADLGASESTDSFGFEGGDDAFLFEEGGTDEFAFEGEEATDDIFGSGDFFGDDTAFPESPLTETSPDPFAQDTGVESDPFAAPDSFASDQDMFGGDFQTDDTFAAEDTTSDVATTFDSSYEDTSYGTEEETRSYVPVKKMADSAFRQSGTLLNRIYIVREGDTLSSVAQKIFGSDRSSDLITWNPYFASRSPNVGDKIYYPSPSQPDDNSMLTYYEDQGIPSQSYEASAGENIRAISKQLLGHDRSWMEVWATNANVESKADLYQAVTLRYWPDGVAASPVAAAPPAPSEDPFGSLPDIAGSEPPSFDDDPFAPIEPPSDSFGGLNPPPPGPPSFDDDPFGSGVAAQSPPPPPPQVDELTLPPPPPPPRAAAKPAASAGAGDDNMILLIAGGGIVAALILIMLLIRRRKNSIDMGHTQV